MSVFFLYLSHLITKIILLFSANTDMREYIIEVIIEVNVSQMILFEQIKSSQESSSALQIDNTIEIAGLNITTGKLYYSKSVFFLNIIYLNFFIINVFNSKEFNCHYVIIAYCVYVISMWLM